ncbi:hypothetical protein KAH94_06005 [bacterium]|nr:hypothetical protein [bacterium]
MKKLIAFVFLATFLHAPSSNAMNQLTKNIVQTIKYYGDAAIPMVIASVSATAEWIWPVTSTKHNGEREIIVFGLDYSIRKALMARAYKHYYKSQGEQVKEEVYTRPSFLNRIGTIH